jgi:hypothetical protein
MRDRLIERRVTNSCLPAEVGCVQSLTMSQPTTSAFKAQYNFASALVRNVPLPNLRQDEVYDTTCVGVTKL